MSIRLEIPEWTGSTLTGGAFSEYVGRVVAAFKSAGYENIALTSVGPALESEQTRFAEFINRQHSYDETPEIAKLDANRDALWKAFYHAWNYLMQLDPSHPLYASALKLRSEMTPYKGVWTHELTKETSELKGLMRDLDTEENARALDALGLRAIVFALNAANTQVANIIGARDAERGSRIADKGGETTASIRKAVVTILLDAYRQVNAAARISDNEFCAAAIQEVNGRSERHHRPLQGRCRAAHEEEGRRRTHPRTRPGACRVVIGRRQIGWRRPLRQEASSDRSKVLPCDRRRFSAVRKCSPAAGGDFRLFESVPLQQEKTFKRSEQPKFCDLTQKQRIYA